MPTDKEKTTVKRIFCTGASEPIVDLIRQWDQLAMEVLRIMLGSPHFNRAGVEVVAQDAYAYANAMMRERHALLRLEGLELEDKPINQSN